MRGYLAKAPKLPPGKQFNASGRAIPDVSSFSENVAIVVNGEEAPVGMRIDSSLFYHHL